jgi:predicted nuclease of restriction endonuclease-like (RecB) superfamily
MNRLSNQKAYINDIKQILEFAKQKACSAINFAMVEAYWLIGKRIVEEKQQGQQRAAYGEEILQTLSEELTKEFGKGFSYANLRNFRQFYYTFPEQQICYTLCSKLNWSHIRSIMRVDNEAARLWYLKEAAEQTWSVRTLDRNIGSQYYERMLLSQHKDLVEKEMLEKTADTQTDKLEFIKNPVVAEFLGFKANTDFTENDLEKAILSNLQDFLMEMGKGFAFVSRQQHIRSEERDYFIDLVFYNYILKSFVLIDLKTTQISYQDVGQMDMYVQMYDKIKRSENDNPTIGIILCSETDSDVARYSILAKSDQLFASKYKLYMPTEEELRREIERQKEIFRLKQIK